MKWTGAYRVNANEVDLNNIVSASSLLKYMQDAATSEMEEDGPSYDSLMEQGLSFVLSRIRISSYTPLHTHDRLEVQSWACESRGAQFNRCYRVLRDGIIVAEGVSVWALVGLRDRKLHRVTEFDFHYRQDDMLELDLPARFRIPEDAALVLNGERTVEYADADMNGHMNNPVPGHPLLLPGNGDEGPAGDLHGDLLPVGGAPGGEHQVLRRSGGRRVVCADGAGERPGQRRGRDPAGAAGLTAERETDDGRRDGL